MNTSAGCWTQILKVKQALLCPLLDTDKQALLCPLLDTDPESQTSYIEHYTPRRKVFYIQVFKVDMKYMVDMKKYIDAGY